MDAIQNQKFYLGKSALMDGGCVSTQGYVRITSLHAFDMSVSSFPEFELSLADIKAAAIVSQVVNHPECPTVHEMFGSKDLTIR